MGLTPDTWKGRRVAVTGHTGFKGSWLCLVLQELGASILGLSLPPDSEIGAYRAMAPWPGLSEDMVDVRDAAAVRSAVAAFTPEIVFHLAAQALVRRGHREPVLTFETNVLGTLHVLDAAMAADAACVVVTSDKVYRDGGQGRPHPETDPLGGDDPYSASKACAELVIDSFRGSNPGARAASARAGNVLGGGDTGKDRLVPDILSAVAAGATVELRNPDAVRPWQHVLDPVWGYLLLGERLLLDPATCPRAVNFGPTGTAVTVQDLTDQVVRASGGGSWRASSDAEDVSERQALQIDASLAKASLGWSPRVALNTAVEWTVDWQRALREGDSTRSVAETQIRRYLAGHS